jgi:hypothetical protein
MVNKHKHEYKHVGARRFTYGLFFLIMTIWPYCLIAANDQNTLIDAKKPDYLYKLVTSENSAVCDNVLSIVNNDLEKYWRVIYENHDEFVKWETLVEKNSPRTPPSPVTMVIEDINNDGKKELLVRTRYWLSSQITENISIFWNTQEEIVKKLNGQEIGINNYHKLIEVADQNIDFSTRHYPLKKAPGYVEYESERGRVVKKPSIFGGIVLLNIYKYKEINYLVVDPYLLTDNLWLVVLKYQGNNTYQDICYLQTYKRRK